MMESLEQWRYARSESVADQTQQPLPAGARRSAMLGAMAYGLVEKRAEELRMA